ncbi:FAD-binding oxidoreductase [Sphingomicrobium clamense]|uniref:FAD-binding oxidoreductase n=1 Tax=Sphingomicrobium clamense TaxID=2851013 RepID=A0ABS6V605_9SPHN|nr:FAD-binding oxidoreductase [Sphingomicrobium sp. B8]MBW0144503.1 FAD-binding oxidoreductase [Sphingomicrobium sp. B8]
MSVDTVIETLRGQLGDKVVVTDADAIAPWLTDWRGRWTGASKALLQPSTTQEVATIVKACNEAGVPLVAQGGNSSMVGGATPNPDGGSLLLSMRSMNNVRMLDAEAGTVVAEAGVILANLHDTALKRGLRFPLTLGAKGSATVGGLVSTNAGGTQVLRFGTMRGLTLGLEAVLPDGTIHDGLGGLKKDNRGPSLDQLLIGAEGTLGVVTAALLKLAPAPVARSTAFAGVKSPAAALRLLRRMTDLVEGFELLPHDSLEAAQRHMDVSSPLASKHDWYVLVEATQAKGQEDARALLERLLAYAMEDGLVEDAAIASNEAQSEAMWRIRDGLSDSEKQVYGLATQHDISVPVDAIPEFLKRVKSEIEREWPGSWVSGYGHLGDGNIHLHVRAMDRACEGWQESEGKEIGRRVHDLVTEAGGSISAEHGIGQMKRDELARLGEPARLTMLRALKAALDPKRIMNPGKLIP